jgi:hypothetical protein
MSVPPKKAASVLLVCGSKSECAAALAGHLSASCSARVQKLTAKRDLVLLLERGSRAFHVGRVRAPASAARIDWLARGSVGLLREENRAVADELDARLALDADAASAPLTHAQTWLDDWPQFTFPLAANETAAADDGATRDSAVDHDEQVESPLPATRPRRKRSIGDVIEPVATAVAAAVDEADGEQPRAAKAAGGGKKKPKKARRSNGAAADDDEEFVVNCADPVSDDLLSDAGGDEIFADTATAEGGHDEEVDDEHVDGGNDDDGDNDDEDDDEDDEDDNNLHASGAVMLGTGDFTISFSRRTWDAAALVPPLPKTMESRIARLPRGARGGTRGRPRGTSRGTSRGAARGRGRGRGRGAASAAASAAAAAASSALGGNGGALEFLSADAQHVPPPSLLGDDVRLSGELASNAVLQVQEMAQRSEYHAIARALDVDTQIAVALGELPGTVRRDETATAAAHGARSVLLCHCDHSTYGCGYVHAARAEAVILRRALSLLCELYENARSLAGVERMADSEASARLQIAAAAAETVTRMTENGE